MARFVPTAFEPGSELCPKLTKCINKLLSLYLLNSLLSNGASNTTRVVVSIKRDNAFKVLSIMLVTSYEFRTWLVEKYIYLYK